MCFNRRSLYVMYFNWDILYLWCILIGRGDAAVEDAIKRICALDALIAHHCIALHCTDCRPLVADDSYCRNTNNPSVLHPLPAHTWPILCHFSFQTTSWLLQQYFWDRLAQLLTVSMHSPHAAKCVSWGGVPVTYSMLEASKVKWHALRGSGVRSPDWLGTQLDSVVFSLSMNICG